ncbi:MAG TPA: hypothetical protein VGL88_13250 [Pseudonocardiaceae bacterium]|jgi:hypothetical protein
MNPAEVDAVLAELAEVVTDLMGEAARAERELDTLSLESDRFVEAPQDARKVPNPRRALVSVREELAAATARVLRDASRDLASWWADAATHATAAAVAGKPVLPARLAVADPDAYLDADDLGFLPPPPDDVYQLAGLAARMAATPLACSGQTSDVDLAASARDLAGQAGLVIRRGPGGEPTLDDDLFPQGRRCRMWGSLWFRHRLPALPSPEELTDLLSTLPVPKAVIDDIQRAVKAVADIVDAELLIVEIDESDTPWTDNADQLLRQTEAATEILARYAEILTMHLPTIRAAASTQL